MSEQQVSNRAREAMIEVVSIRRRPKAISEDSTFVADWMLMELYCKGFVLVPIEELPVDRSTENSPTQDQE